MTVTSVENTRVTPIRERNSRALRGLSDARPPDIDEARIDRLKIKVLGTIRGASADAINGYLSHLNSVDPHGEPKLFCQLGNRGSQRSAEVRKSAWTISAGSIQFNGSQSACERRIVLKLDLNPTRTLQHLLADHDFENISSIHPADFFARREHAYEETVAATLTRTDNALIGRQNLGGAVALYRGRRWREFLEIYEAQLKELISQALMPFELGFPGGETEGHGQIQNEQIDVRLDWARLTIEQAEVYFERWTNAALRLARRAADRGLTAAAEASLRQYELVGADDAPRRAPGIDRQNTAYQLVLPQTQNIDLAMYAKTNERVRFEMRYRRKITNAIGGRPSVSDQSPLSDWLAALSEHAAARLPWTGLSQLFEPTADQERDGAIVELAAAVQKACVEADAVGEFGAVFEMLFEDRGVSEGAIPDEAQAVLISLVRSGVLIEQRLRHSRRGIPRRWVLGLAFSSI